MKNIKYFIGIVFMLSCISCVSPKNIGTQKQVDYAGEFMKISNEIANLRIDVRKQTETTNKRLSNLKLEHKTTILSLPDSTGKQYPVQTSETNINKEEKESTYISDILAMNIDRMYLRIDSLERKINAALNEKQKVVELSWWNLHKDKVYTGLLVSILLIIFYGKTKK